jgi:hypothetical protein
MKGQKNPQFILRKICPARDRSPKAIRIAPPTSAPVFERLVCTFFLLSKTGLIMNYAEAALKLLSIYQGSG